MLIICVLTQASLTGQVSDLSTLHTEGILCSEAHAWRGTPRRVPLPNKLAPYPYLTHTISSNTPTLRPSASPRTSTMHFLSTLVDWAPSRHTTLDSRECTLQKLYLLVTHLNDAHIALLNTRSVVIPPPYALRPPHELPPCTVLPLDSRRLGSIAAHNSRRQRMHTTGIVSTCYPFE